MIYLQVFWEFFKTGLFAVGGGLATLPFLSKISEKYGWFTQQDIGNMLAVSEATPGPIGVNMATYVGNTIGNEAGGMLMGVLCGILATLSLVLPSYLVVLAVEKVMARFSENKFVQGAMKTLRPASVGMVTAAVLGILQSVLFSMDAAAIGQWNSFVLFPNLILFLLIFMFYQKFNKLHPVIFLAIGAIAGICLKLLVSVPVFKQCVILTSVLPFPFPKIPPTLRPLVVISQSDQQLSIITGCLVANPKIPPILPCSADSSIASA